MQIGAKTAWQIESDDELNGLVAFAGEDYDDITYIGPPELEHQVQAWIDWELYHNHDDN